MDILITGGAGFIGSNLAVVFSRKIPEARVTCFDNLYRRGSELNLLRLREHGVTFHYGDVRQKDSFPKGPFDFLIECSAEPSVLASAQSSAYAYQTNLTGAYNCLEKARQWHSKFLFLSTSRVYPFSILEAHPWVETSERFVWRDFRTTAGLSDSGVSEQLAMEGARSMYGWTKYAAELLIEEYKAEFSLKAAINRCGVVAGPWQFGKVDQGVVTHWVLCHVLGRPLNYVGYGGHGKQVRDLLHVDDLCELVVQQTLDFDSWEGWRGNVAGGTSGSISLLELTTICQEIVGKAIAIGSIPEKRRADLRIFIGDCQRLFEKTDWRPKRSIEEIVADTYDWVVAHGKQLDSLK